MRHETVAQVQIEARNAEEKYGDFSSTHEAFGVLAEEVSELLDAIRRNDLANVAKESAQVSAVAMRLANQCGEPTVYFVKRSTGGKR